MTRHIEVAVHTPVTVPSRGGSEEKAHHLHRIDATLLIPGRGDPIDHASVIVADGKIEWVGPQNEMPKKYHDLSVTSTPCVLPGLWDCHTHFLGALDFKLDSLASQHLALSGVRIASSATKVLNAGFTSVRELLGYGVQLQTAIDEGFFPGPNIYSAVAGLSQTAGHGDLHDVNMGLLKDLCCHGLCICIADGVEECRRAVRTQIRAGAKVIKVMATGGVLSSIDSPYDAQYSLEEMKVIVEEATRSGLTVAAHAHGKAGIMQALKAGVATIEHGSEVDEEVCELMKKTGAILVATRAIQEELVNHAELMTPESFAKVEKIVKASRKAYELAIKRGVRIALGTDTGVDRPDMEGPAHGKNGIEFSWAVKAGMTPLQAIEAGTAMGPLTLGTKWRPLSGQIKAGYDADLIAVLGNPLEEIEILSKPDNITHVWKAGKLQKQPSK